MWNELWENHKGKCIGVAAGVFFGIIYLISGFWDMMFFGLLILVGFYIGGKVDRKQSWDEISKLYQWLTDRWNMFR